MIRTAPRALIIALLIPLLFGTAAHALSPRNPQRPMTAKTCAEALDRLEEAIQGSPMVGDAANREVALEVLADARRLCAGNNAPA